MGGARTLYKGSRDLRGGVGQRGTTEFLKPVLESLHIFSDVICGCFSDLQFVLFQHFKFV